jgi:hypothetical protein
MRAASAGRVNASLPLQDIRRAAAERLRLERGDPARAGSRRSPLSGTAGKEATRITAKRPRRTRRVIVLLCTIGVAAALAYGWRTYARVRGYQAYLTEKSTALAEASEAGDVAAVERIAGELVSETRTFSDSLPTEQAKIFDVSAYAVSEWYRRVGPLNAMVDRMNAAGAFDAEPMIGRTAIDEKLRMWAEFDRLTRDALGYIDSIEGELKARLDEHRIGAEHQRQLLDGFRASVQLGANRRLRESDLRLAVAGVAIQRFCRDYGHLIRDGGAGGNWILPPEVPREAIDQYNGAIDAFRGELELQGQLEEAMRLEAEAQLGEYQEMLR